MEKECNALNHQVYNTNFFSDKYSIVEKQCMNKFCEYFSYFCDYYIEHNFIDE